MKVITASVIDGKIQCYLREKLSKTKKLFPNCKKTTDEKNYKYRLPAKWTNSGKNRIVNSLRLKDLRMKRES